MAKVKITGHASGSGVITVTAPNTSTDRTITLPDATCTLADNSDVTTKLPLAGGSMTGHLELNDNVKAAFGQSGDLEIFHDGSHSRIKDVGTGYLVLSGTEIHFNDSSNSNNRIKIDSAGVVSMPAQPAFQVGATSTQSNKTTGTDHTVLFGGETFDVGSNFASNTFTAPVTGKYQLTANVRADQLDSAAAYYHIKIKTSNRDYWSIFDPDFGQDATYWHLSYSILADMDAGDTAYVAFTQSGGTAQADIDGDAKYTNFSGYLAC